MNQNYTWSPPAEEEERHDDNHGNNHEGSHRRPNNDADLSVVFISYVGCKHGIIWGNSKSWCRNQ